MGVALRNKLKAERLESDIEEALLNVLVAAGYIRERLEQTCAGHGITAAQYNVLRILNGGPPDGYARREILERMIERAPDCTRLIDRLEKQGYVRRNRTRSDRRLSLTQITARGRELLGRMIGDIQDVQQRVAGRLSPRDRRELSTILEKVYGGGPER